MFRMPGRSYRGPLPPADDPLRALEAELRKDVRELAEWTGERNVLRAPKGLARTAEYVEAQWAAVGYAAQRQTYHVARVPCSNLEVELPGTTCPEEIVLVGAHYDSVIGSPGANDNGSGVATLLALARRLAARLQPRTLRFVAFVNEEPPYFQTGQMGSRVYARRCAQRGEKIVAMLSLETLGYYTDQPGSQRYPAPFGWFYPSTGNFLGVVGNLRSSRLVRRVVGSFRRAEKFPCEGGAVPAAVPGVGFSDHWSFWQEGYRAAMLTDTAMFRYPHYHLASDTPDKIHYGALARVMRGLGAVIQGLASQET